MKTLPFEFILEDLQDLSPVTNPMFGGYAIYVGDKIVFMLRERESSPRDNGLWIATTADHHESLRRDFPSMRSIEVFGKDGPTGWQVLPADADDFEEAALRACEFVRGGDVRIGKVPKAKSRSRSPRKAAGGAKKKRAGVRSTKKSKKKRSSKG